MKKLMAIMLVVFAVPALAVQATWTDNMDGTATLVLDATGDGENIVGLGLDVDSDVDLMIDSIAPAELNIYMDYAYDQAGAYTYGAGTVEDAKADQDAAGAADSDMSFAVSAGYLNGETTAGADGAAVVTIVFSAASNANVTIGENAIRGGIVGVDGTDLDLTGDTGGTITAGGAACCYGDIADSAASPAPDSKVDTGDLNFLIGTLAAGGFNPISVAQGDPLYCADISDSAASIGLQDGQVDTGDLNLMIGLLAAGGFGDIGCITW